MATKTPASANEPVEVLFALHDGFNLTDFAGPLEVLASALHDKNDESMGHLLQHTLPSVIM